MDGVTTDYTYNNLDQLISAGSVTYDYDDRGNLYQAIDGSQTTTYTYDAADRLTTVNGPSSTVQFAYDADGRRIKQTIGSAITNYLWDEVSAYGDVVLETNDSGATLASYVLGADGIISQSRSGSTSYYLQDGQGSTRALTNSSGAVIDAYSYTAFGELLDQTGSTTNSYLYTGQQFDSLTELYDLRARYYNPALGRFLSQDTYPYDFSNPAELNRYVYAANRPINLNDPTGNAALFEYVKLGIMAGGALGGLSAIACGGDTGDIAKAIVIGAAFGGAFGAGLFYLYQPVLAFGTGLALGNAAVEAYDGIVNGWNTCNGFNFAISLVMVTLGGRGLAKDINLGGPRLWGPPLEATASNARPPRFLFRRPGSPSTGPAPEEISPQKAQAMIDWVVRNLFDDPWFRRKITIRGKEYQFISSSKPRFPPEYDPNLNAYGATEPNRYTKIGPESIKGGPLEILRTIIHEEIHHWMYEQGFSQLEVAKVERNVDIYLLLILDGWNGPR